jgi:hypothetical protein
MDRDEDVVVASESLVSLLFSRDANDDFLNDMNWAKQSADDALQAPFFGCIQYLQYGLVRRSIINDDTQPKIAARNL